MNDALFSFCANVFGFLTGGISLLGLVVAVCRPHLPSNKIKTLDSLLDETEFTFKEAVEAGLLVPEFVQKTEERLTILKQRTCTFRTRAYSATTLRQDYAEFLHGTSRAIGHICQSVRKLRAEVITSSQERRHRLMQMSSEHTHSNPVTRHQPLSTPPALIPRPNSCPPSLPAQQSDHVRIVPIDIDRTIGRIGRNCPQESNYPSDSLTDSRGASDVRTVSVQH